MTGQATGDASAALDQAFDNAVATVAGDTDGGAQHSEDTDEAAGPDDETADGAQDTDSDEDAGGEDGDDTDDEQDSTDADGDDEADDEVTQVAAKPQDPSDETFAGLKDKHKAAFRNLPPEARKAVDAYFTQRTQKMSQDFSALQTDAQYGAQLVAALRTNPKQALLEAARTLGVELIPQAPDAEAKKLSAAVIAALKGTPMEENAEALAAALSTAMSEAGKPAKEAAAALERQTRVTNATSEFQAFQKTHPDWKNHETALNSLLDEMPKPENVTWKTHLDRLYTIASRGTSIARAAKKTVERTVKAAARKTGSDAKPRSTQSSRVAHTPPTKFPTLDEAAAAAEQGIQWEHSR